MKARAMSWIHRLNSIISRFTAIYRREKLRLRTASALRQLDDRLLADIGVPRGQIATYARRAAHKAVPIPAMPNFDRGSVPARPRSKREKRQAIGPLSLLDDRLLKDIGIELRRTGDAVDSMLMLRGDLEMAYPAVQLSGAMRAFPAPARARSHVPATLLSDLCSPKRNDGRPAIGAERMPDVGAMRERVANESQPAEPRRHASAGG